MRGVAVVWIGLAGLALAAHAAPGGEPALVGLAIGLSILWIATEIRRTSRATLFLTGFVVLAGLAAASGRGFLLPTLALTAALYGWDAALATSRLDGHATDGRRRLSLRYAAAGGVQAVVGVGLVAAASLLRLRLSFGGAIGLLVGFVGVATAVGLLSRPAPAPDAESAPSGDAPVSPERERAGRRLSPDPEDSVEA